MVGEDPFGDPIGVGRGAKDLALVVLQHVDPRVDVARMVRNVEGSPSVLPTNRLASSALYPDSPALF